MCPCKVFYLQLTNIPGEPDREITTVAAITNINTALAVLHEQRQKDPHHCYYLSNRASPNWRRADVTTSKIVEQSHC